ncbi:MAG: hypothetical protein IKK93_10835 [Campylobacter sp.]|nr:hypothetical protein [Campylobacter sp.]
MTNEEFVAICKQYQEEYCKWLHPDNLKAITPLYKKYKKFCIENLLNEDDESSVYDWLNQNTNNPDIMIDSLNAKFIGHDPVDKHKIIILGEYKDSIKLKTQIKRGNEKQLIEEIKQQIKDIIGYDPFYHEGGNHIEFKDNNKVLYAIEWHFDPKYEQNIIKQTCKELQITQRELAEIIKVNDGTVRQWSSKGDVMPNVEVTLNLLLENHKLKSQLDKIKGFAELLAEIQR